MRRGTNAECGIHPLCVVKPILGTRALGKCCGLPNDVATTYIVVMTLSIRKEVDRVTPWHDRLSQAMQTDLERRLRSIGATSSQFRLLAAIARNDARTVRGLAAVLSVDGGAVTRLADRVVAKGL